MPRQNQHKQKVVLGLTGSFGSGKTTVAGIFRSFGAKIVDADRLARRLAHPQGKIYKRITLAFGRGILKKNKTIDREKLSQIVFKRKDSLRELNRIMHPEIIRMLKKETKSAKQKLVVMDAPLLIEAGLADFADKVVVVKIDREKQIERLKKRTSLSKGQILLRIKSQIPLRNKACLADFIIDNNGSIAETRKQAEAIRRKLWKN